MVESVLKRNINIEVNKGGCQLAVTHGVNAVEEAQKADEK
jgi:hypothetical protein